MFRQTKLSSICPHNVFFVKTRCKYSNNTVKSFKGAQLPGCYDALSQIVVGSARDLN